MFVIDAKQLKWEMERDRWLKGNNDRRNFRKKGHQGFKGKNRWGPQKHVKGKGKGRRK